MNEWLQSRTSVYLGRVGWVINSDVIKVYYYIKIDITDNTS